MIINRALFSLLICLVCGCATYNGPCAYHLLDNGWFSHLPPQSLIDKYNSDNDWYSNESGDFFACPEVIRGKACVGVYQIFKRQDDGSFEEEHIACVE